jgi:hypothetical protein
VTYRIDDICEVRIRVADHHEWFVCKVIHDESRQGKGRFGVLVLPFVDIDGEDNNGWYWWPNIEDMRKLRPKKDDKEK